ncbi:MAG: ferredoxin, partial [Pseudomonadota bacterium]
MSLDALRALADLEALEVLGTCLAAPEDEIGKGTVALLGPREPGFWAHATAAPEFGDGARDPLDRWSFRVITELADRVDAIPLFPFGQPARPFMRWALRSGRAWSSPVGMLVHDRAGLLVSFRGAVVLSEELEEWSDQLPPCEACEEMPCLQSCPVNALDGNGYAVNDCHDYLDTADGRGCLDNGCQVRR